MRESDKAGEVNGNANHGSPKWTELRRVAASTRTLSTRNARWAGLGVAAAATVCLSLGVRLTAENEKHGDNEHGQWRAAVSVDPGGHLGINTAAGEGCPMESPDAHMLFFASNRGGGQGNNDIWVSFRPSVGSPWESPVNLGAPVNSPAADFCPTPLPGNQLLFVSARGNLCGGAGNNPDIYYTRLQPTGGWVAPEHLGCNINSGFEEFSPSLVEAHGRTMLFFSSNRLGTHDIFVSVRQSDGQWGPAEPVEELNSTLEDSRPNVRKDGLEIVFDSNRDGGATEIYTASRSSVHQRWSRPRRLLDTTVNSASAETRPTISRDGTRLYFGSGRPDAESGTTNDLYVATRTRSRRD